MSRKRAVFCCSVDGGDTNHLSTELAARRADVVAMLEDFAVPSNWTFYGFSEATLPRNSEQTAFIPKGLDRPSLLKHLRQVHATLIGRGDTMYSVVMNPHEARANWDLLVRHGCRVARSRTAEATRDPGAKVLRGGLWSTPLSCQFVGGSRRSVRSLLGICQRRLIEAATQGDVFHLGIDFGATRKSWTEECTALRALMKTACELHQTGRLVFAGLGDVPNVLTDKSERPMLSILRVA